MSLQDDFANLLKDVEKLKQVTTSSDILDEVVNFSEIISLTSSDSVSITEQDTGTFVWGSARWGFADWK